MGKVVYCVSEYNEAESNIAAVYSSEEEANRHAALKGFDRERLVQAFDIQETCLHHDIPVYQCSASDPEITKNPFWPSTSVRALIAEQIPENGILSCETRRGRWTGAGHFTYDQNGPHFLVTVESTRSPEHAKEAVVAAALEEAMKEASTK